MRKDCQVEINKKVDAITCKYARELLKYSEEQMNTLIEVMCSEHITELQGVMIVL